MPTPQMPKWTIDIFRKWRNWNPLNGQQEPSVLEEQEKIKLAASDFDALVVLPAWDRVLQFMAARVNDKIIEATKTEMVNDVIKWNAKRELLDDVINEVESTRRMRDEILAMEKEMEQTNG